MNDFEAAKAAFLDGVALVEQGRLAEADARLATSLRLLPGRASTLLNLGIVRLRRGRPADALQLLEQALAAEPGARDAAFQRAAALAALGRLDEAAAQLHALLALHPSLGVGWSLLGQVEKDRGRAADARAAFEHAQREGADTPAVRFALAALGGGAMPAAAPPGYVKALFDGYADDFEAHLLGTLHYRGHEAVVAAVRDAAPFDSVLDLGCGTGLCGPLLRPLARTLAGVDLSATMVERARARGVYDHVHEAEIVAHLAATAERHDAVVAADVLIYLGDLAPLFAGVARVLRPGGRFAFTVEAAEGPGIELRPSLRYAHGTPAVLATAALHGFALVSQAAVVLREEQRVPVDGAVFAFTRPA